MLLLRSLLVCISDVLATNRYYINVHDYLFMYMIIRYTNITPWLIDLQCLPVKQHIYFKVLTITFKAIHGLAPTYISELIKVKEQSHYNLRSNQELLLAVPPTRFLATLGARSFSSACSTLWMEPSTDSYKEHYRLHCL